MQNILGIEKVKSMQTTGSRSMPPNMNQPYIDMFMLRKEKERLEKEGARLDTRRERVVERLKEIEKDLRRLGYRDSKEQKQEKRDFDWDAKWVKMKKEVNPEEPKKPKIERGWKVKALNMKKQNR